MPRSVQLTHICLQCLSGAPDGWTACRVCQDGKLRRLSTPIEFADFRELSMEQRGDLKLMPVARGVTRG